MGIGVWEVVAVAAIVAMLFPRRLHALARACGECVGLIQRGRDHDSQS